MPNRLLTRSNDVQDSRAASAHHLRIEVTSGSDMTIGRLIAAGALFFGCMPVMMASAGTPSKEFTWGIGIGAAVAMLKLAFDFWRLGQEGAPLVRLRSRFDWRTALVTVLLAVGCYYINQQLLFWNTFVSIALGIGCGAAMVATAEILVRDKLDLCENGVVVLRTAFLPWKSVRVRWDPEGSGALVLRNGWRRMPAKVPPEYREVMDRVLGEIVGLEHASILAAATEHADQTS
jgi:hypothetical protein